MKIKLIRAESATFTNRELLFNRPVVRIIIVFKTKLNKKVTYVMFVGNLNTPVTYFFSSIIPELVIFQSPSFITSVINFIKTLKRESSVLEISLFLHFFQ